MHLKNTSNQEDGVYKGDTVKNTKVNILGTVYRIEHRNRADDDILSDADGYCDKTLKLIVICNKDNDSDLGDFEYYRKKTMRHEIIHAFLYESGLAENWEHKPYGHEETVVDWIAYMFPKIQKAFEAVGCL